MNLPMRRPVERRRVVGLHWSQGRHPHRGERKGTSVARKGVRIGFLGAVGLVLLRMVIGWHFLYAGIDKLTNPDFTSEGFLGQAKGPLADEFHKRFVYD